MSEPQPTNPEGVERTPAGEIKDQKPTQPATTPNPESSAKPEGDKPSLLNEKDAPSGAPEKYEDFKAPEAWAEKGLELDPKMIEQAAPLFKELGLSQEAAQKLIDFYTSVAEANHDSSLNTVADMRKEWRDSVAGDKDIGGKLPQVKSTISKAIDSLGDAKLASAFREAMDLTGAGDHPAFIKAFYKLAQKVTEGTNVKGGGPSKFGQERPGAPKSAASAMYPDLPSAG